MESLTPKYRPRFLHYFASKDGIQIIIIVCLYLASPATASISYFALLVYSLSGRVQAVKALAISWLFALLNPGIATGSSLTVFGRYAVVAGAAVSIFVQHGHLQQRKRIDPIVTVTLLLGTFMVVHSYMISPVPEISILKAVLWTIVMVTLLSAWPRLSAPEIQSLEHWLYGGLVLIMLFSLPLISSSVGYLSNRAGFQGILSHPQTFGPAMALLAVWTIGRMIMRNPPPWTAIVITVASLFLVVMSEARTAGLALVLGLFVSIITATLSTGRTMGSIAPALRSWRFQGLMLFALLAAMVNGSAVLSFIDNFMSKSGRAGVTGIIEAYDQSRGDMIESMWANIDANPWTGIGFGIPSNIYDLKVTRDPVLGLPVSSAIEKGVIPVAVLEELGIPGFLLVLYWVWLVIRRSASRGIIALAIVVVALLVNFGEAVLFSTGGLGLVILILISWAVVKPVHYNSSNPSAPKRGIADVVHLSQRK